MKNKKTPFNLERKEIDLATFLFFGVNNNLKHLFDVDVETILMGAGNLNCPVTTEHVFILYIERALRDHPKSDSLKLFLAYFYSKQIHLCAIALTLLEEVEKGTPAPNIALTASYLRVKIEKK